MLKGDLCLRVGEEIQFFNKQCKMLPNIQLVIIYETIFGDKFATASRRSAFTSTINKSRIFLLINVLNKAFQIESFTNDKESLRGGK